MFIKFSSSLSIFQPIVGFVTKDKLQAIVSCIALGILLSSASYWICSRFWKSRRVEPKPLQLEKKDLNPVIDREVNQKKISLKNSEKLPSLPSINKLKEKEEVKKEEENKTNKEHELKQKEIPLDESIPEELDESSDKAAPSLKGDKEAIKDDEVLEGLTNLRQDSLSSASTQQSIIATKQSQSTNKVFDGDLCLIEEVLPFESFPGIKYRSPIDEKLNALETLFLHAILALTNFQDNKIASFDAQVGDELCEIRTYMMISFKNNQPELQSDLKVCQDGLACIKKIQSLIKKIREDAQKEIVPKMEFLVPYRKRNTVFGLLFRHEMKTISKQISRNERQQKLDSHHARYHAIFDLFGQKCLPTREKIGDIRLNCEKICNETFSKNFSKLKHKAKLSAIALMIVNAHILSMIKKQEFMEKGFFQNKTCITQLKIDGVQFPTVIYNSVINHLKEAILKRSMLYVKEETEQLSDSNEKDFLTNVFSKKYDIHKKEQYPFHYVMRAIYQRLRENNICIVFKARPKTSIHGDPSTFALKKLFKVDSKVSDYIPVELEKQDFSLPAFVVETFSSQSADNLKNPKFFDNFLKESGGLLNYLINLDAVQHTQFVTDKKNKTKETEKVFDVIQVSDEERNRLKELRKLSKAKGFSQDNSSICCVEHVYPDFVGNQFIQTTDSKV